MNGRASAQLRRWEQAVGFRGSEFSRFAKGYYSRLDRRLLLIAGAGFDPRSPRLSEAVGQWAKGRVSGVFVREERPTSSVDLRALAESNLARLVAAIPEAQVETIDIFAMDNAVIGGRNAAEIAARLKLDGVTDVLVDMSALSVGTGFPILGVLLSRAATNSFNLHATVVADAALDAAIVPQPAEAASAVHGYRGKLGLDSYSNAARLWLPQLATGRSEVLDRVFRELAPHDICPILPFPAQDPRAGDALIEEYLTELEDVWDVDVRNMIYAAEDDPLDVYRTILQLDDALKPVFEGDGGAICVLSPVGSKVLALGAFLAAAERDCPVYQVEAVGFSANVSELTSYPSARGEFAHVWLAGDPYRVQNE